MCIVREDWGVRTYRTAAAAAAAAPSSLALPQYRGGFSMQSFVLYMHKELRTQVILNLKKHAFRNDKSS
jgi:hypothetical protein